MTRPHAQKRVTQPRENLLADLCTFFAAKNGTEKNMRGVRRDERMQGQSWRRAVPCQKRRGEERRPRFGPITTRRLRSRRSPLSLSLSPHHHHQVQRLAEVLLSVADWRMILKSVHPTKREKCRHRTISLKRFSALDHIDRRPRSLALFEVPSSSPSPHSTTRHHLRP